MSGTIRALKNGDLINNYKIQSYHDKGGFSIVYKAIDLHSFDENKKVIIKEYFPIKYSPERMMNSNYIIVSDEKISDYKKFLRILIDNYIFLKKLKEQNQYLINLVNIIDVFELNNTAYIVMEESKGQTLKNILVKNPQLDYDQIIKIFIQILDGLRFLHKNEIYHLDIKPSNIFVSNEEQPIHYLIDFGSAHFNQNTSDFEVLHQSPKFSPPEFYDSSNSINSRSDIYALGVTLYTCIGGKLNNSNECLKIINQKERSKIPSAVSQFSGQYPEKLLELIDDCLILDKNQRPKDAEAVQDRLISLHNNLLLSRKKNQITYYPNNKNNYSGDKENDASTSGIFLAKRYQASFKLRLLALIIDCLFIVTPVFLILLISSQTLFNYMNFYLIFISGSIFLGLIYFSLLESSLQGSTIGKDIFNITTIDNNGNSLKFTSAWLRSFCKIIFCIFFILGFKFKNRYIHDFIMNTFVVYKI